MKKIPKKLMIPLIISFALMVGGAIGSFALSNSGLTFESEDYNAWFYLNHLQVHLLENGRDVCEGHNDLDGSKKVSGELVQYLGYHKDGEKAVLGNVEPGMRYKEEIAARNGQDIPIYLRLTVRKYWVVCDEEGHPTDKVPELSPEKIHLSYGEKDYNDSKWFLNEKESTSEMKTYYYKTKLTPEKKDTEPLFDSLVLDNKLVEKEEVSREKNEETGVTTIKYRYKYDGYAFVIKADVQAVQTHNINDAIKSQWGVDIVTCEGGVLKLK